jgi:hypothetical protein|tara:strand:- start:202 stop:378 length:177 start_codon:yes stop_codon:yes gene_type:complete
LFITLEAIFSSFSHTVFIHPHFFQELLEYEKEEFRKFDYVSFLTMMAALELEEKDPAS